MKKENRGCLIEQTLASSDSIVLDLEKISQKSKADKYVRSLDTHTPGISIIRDTFSTYDASCLFIRINLDSEVTINVQGNYNLSVCSAGGWYLQSASGDKPDYWIPLKPRYRVLDKDGHIVSENEASLIDMALGSEQLNITFEAFTDKVLDIVVWSFSDSRLSLLKELQTMSVLETQSYFIYASHTNYSKPSDLYLHVINGWVYGTHWTWPNKWKLCDELDAYALYLIVTGLEYATGKNIYKLFKRQIVQSLVSRQANDGGFYHGEWTQNMESHYRLHSASIQLFTHYVEETKDPEISIALGKAVDFLSGKIDTMPDGIWFLHDSLEASIDSMEQNPLSWHKNNAFGKSVTNMLVLNTHLDSSIALSRGGDVIGDDKHIANLESSKKLVHKILINRPAELLYRVLFAAIDLTFLPEKRASKLPLPLRAIKRIAWKYIIPNLHHIKTVFPRLVMPGGYIDRDLSLKGFAHYYQSVNIWDLIRYRNRFGGEYLNRIIDESLEFVNESGIRELWKEHRRKDALAFWTDALYHLCIKSDQPKYRIWLAESVLDTEDVNLGIAPSTLGLNAEVINISKPWPCPIPENNNLRIVNLCHDSCIEYLLINISNYAIKISFEKPLAHPLKWKIGKELVESEIIPGRQWALASHYIE